MKVCIKQKTVESKLQSYWYLSASDCRKSVIVIKNELNENFGIDIYVSIVKFCGLQNCTPVKLFSIQSPNFNIIEHLWGIE